MMKHRASKNTPAWKRTVFTQFENEQLLAKIQNWSDKKELSVIEGEPNSPDLIAIGCFVLIIDRNLIGEQTYKRYLEIVEAGDDSKDIKDESTCIIVDNIRDLAVPELKMVCQVDINHRNSHDWVVDILNLALKSVR